MFQLKAKQKQLQDECEIAFIEFDRRHNRIRKQIRFYQISDELIAKHKELLLSYAKAKNEIEKRLADPQLDPPDDALFIESARKELANHVEQEEKFAEEAKLKDTQKTLLDEWNILFFELDHSHSRIKNQVKFFQLNDDLKAKHDELNKAFTKAKEEIEARFKDPQYNPPDDALESARRELAHHLEQAKEFVHLARLKDKQKTLLDEWKTVVAEFDKRHDQTLNRPSLQMCNYLKREHSKLKLRYVQVKQAIEARFEDPQYNPPDSALEAAKRELAQRLEEDETFANHVEECYD